MSPEAKEILDETLTEADNLIRAHLLATGIKVPHVVKALIDTGDAVIVSNSNPSMLLEVSEGLRKVAHQNKLAATSIRHRH